MSEFAPSLPPAARLNSFQLTHRIALNIIVYMPSIPLPFVGALMLTVLLMRMVGPWHGDKIDSASLIFISACIAIELLSGLRWSADLPAIRSVQPISAAILPPLAWVCFSPNCRRKALHLVPVVSVVLLVLLWQRFLDLGLASIYIGYGIALLHLALQGPDAFPDVRLGEADRARQAARIAGYLLLALAGADLFVAADFGFERGIHAASIVAVANVLIIVFVALAIASVGSSRPVQDEETAATLQAEITSNDVNVAAQIDRMIREKQLFRDADLTLQRLARRAGIPARQISAALNRVYGRNVSQVVNNYRIEMAQRLLTETDAPIIHILFESGFQTKSNFNREFRRVTGTNPRDWRISAITGSSKSQPEKE
jgi:AraC-like DNA-binding protein